MNVLQKNESEQLYMVGRNYSALIVIFPLKLKENEIHLLDGRQWVGPNDFCD